MSCFYFCKVALKREIQGLSSDVRIWIVIVRDYNWELH